MEVRERWKRILFYYKLGNSPTLIVGLVSEEFGVSKRTVWRDWGKRSEWMPSFTIDESMVEVYLRSSLELFVIRESLSLDIEDTSNVYAKIKACKAIADILFREFEFACNLGYFEPFNKARVMWGLLKEKAGPDMKLIVERFMDVQRTSNPRNRSRRSRILYYLLLGCTSSEISSRVALSFDCSERTVKRDIGRMDEWIASLLPLEDSKVDAYNRVVLDYRFLFQVIYGVLNGDNSYGRVYAMKAENKRIDYKLKLLKMTGAIEPYRLHLEAMRKSIDRENISRIFRESMRKHENKQKET